MIRFQISRLHDILQSHLPIYIDVLSSFDLIYHFRILRRVNHSFVYAHESRFRCHLKKRNVSRHIRLIFLCETFSCDSKKLPLETLQVTESL